MFFLGYPNLQKGYKLMNLVTKQWFVSRDVQFCEHIFPYRKESYKQFMQPIPEVVLKDAASHSYLDDVLLSLPASPTCSTSVVIDELGSHTGVPTDSAADTTVDSAPATVLSPPPHFYFCLFATTEEEC